jgi:uncharacterized protein YoaH (UPF0181 family)
LAVVSSREFYRVLHRIADGRVGAVERAFLDSLGAAVDRLDTKALQAALARGDVAAAVGTLGIDGRFARELQMALAKEIRGVYVAVGTAAEAVAAGPQGWSFDLSNPRAIRYATERSAALVQQVTQDTRRNIRRLIATGIGSGETVQKTARKLRPVLVEDVQATFGLTQRQYRSVERRYYDLVRSGMDPDDARGRMWKFARKKLRQRAETIARTETIDAANAGQHELWEQAAEQGYIDRDVARRFFVISPDDRLCRLCAPVPAMNREGVPLDQPFQTPDGPRMRPPLHPRCRCATALAADGKVNYRQEQLAPSISSTRPVGKGKKSKSARKGAT